MTKTVLATIKWIDPLRGQRFVVPSDAKYSPTILFSDQKLSDEEICNAIKKKKKRNPDGSILAELSYLSEFAPIYHLTSGNKFTLFEGPHKVAQGVIL